MSAFERVRGRVRRVETRRGDTLQRVAARELGDAARWPELASINNLLPPYLTDDPAQAGPRTPLTGSAILVPDLGATALTQSAPDPAAVFGIDASNRGEAGRRGLTVTDGDITTISGYKNFTQALSNRLETRLRELLFHPGYGNGAIDLLGRQANGQTSALNLALIKRAIEGDPRVARTENMTVEVSADVVRTTGTAVAIDGSSLPLEATSGI